ncbi:hypothetical protein M8J76_008428 [Diaphorina citri]|nr:hypothetical protein M8J76_008428 [Diaphorina citri]
MSGAHDVYPDVVPPELVSYVYTYTRIRPAQSRAQSCTWPTSNILRTGCVRAQISTLRARQSSDSVPCPTAWIERRPHWADPCPRQPVRQDVKTEEELVSVMATEIKEEEEKDPLSFTDEYLFLVEHSGEAATTNKDILEQCVIGMDLNKYDLEELTSVPPPSHHQQQQQHPSSLPSVATASTSSFVYVPSPATTPPTYCNLPQPITLQQQPAQHQKSPKKTKNSRSKRSGGGGGGKVRSTRVPVVPKTINQRSAYFWVDNACKDLNFLEPVNGNQIVFKNSDATMPSNWFGSLKNQAFSSKNRLPVVGVANVLPAANITNDLLMLMRLRTVFNGLAESIKMKASKLAVLACIMFSSFEEGTSICNTLATIPPNRLSACDVNTLCWFVHRYLFGLVVPNDREIMCRSTLCVKTHPGVREDWETIVVDATDDDGNEAAAELDADGQHSVDCFSYRDACPIDVMIDVFSFVDTFCSKPRTGSEVDAQWHAIRSHLTSGRNIHLTTMVNEVEIVQNDRLASNLHSIAMSQTDFFLPPDFKTIYFLPAFEWMMVDLKTLVEPWCVKVYYEQDRTKGRKPSQSLRKDEILNSARIDVSRIDSIDNMTTGIYNLHFFTYFSITPGLYDTYVIENQQYVKAPFAVSGGTVFQGHSFVLYEFVRDVRPNSAAAAAAAVAAF